MKYIPIIILFIFSGLKLMGQAETEVEDGAVSYITSQNIYVKFKSTDHLSVGDTLFVQKGESLVPALVINNKSSISCVCTPISSATFTVADKIVAKQKPMQPKADLEPAPKSQPDKPVKPVVVKPVNKQADEGAGSAMTEEPPPQQDINGRISLSSYSNFSNTPGGNSQRMRYTFSLNAKNIANTKLSGETYISFAHKDDNWNEIQDNIFNGLKIYSLALNYQFNNSIKLLFGRKINPRLSNIGAIDGLQFEAKFKSLTAGILAGSRPDYKNYSINTSLFQYGAYLSHDLVSRNGNMQSTLAFAEQKNKGKTDRSFVYFQHTNSLIKKLYFFGTIEFNLYKYDTVSEKLTNTFDLSNIYISLRYRIIKQLSLSLSYSSRQNIIYYETYKNLLDKILDYETLQGYTFRINYNPIRFLSVGVNTGYRFKKTDPRPSKNLYGYVTYSRIPFVNIAATASITLLETSYISGRIYSVGISRNILKGKLQAGLGYRYVDYSYLNSDYSMPQNLAEINLNWHIYKKLALSVNYEGTFEQQNHYNRLYINLTQRF